MGAWTGALVGMNVPDSISRKFEDEIASGRILVVLDGEQVLLDAATSTIVSTGAVALHFTTPTAMT